MTDRREDDGHDGDRPGANGDGADANVENEAEDDHLEDLPDGSGCTEIWEHLEGRRRTEV